MRFTRVRRLMLWICALAPAAGAQTQPATVPIAVAQAVPLQIGLFGMLGKSQYFDGRVPPGWPDALIPAGSRILGGGVSGDLMSFRSRTAVFEVAGTGAPDERIRSLFVKAGFGASPTPPVTETEGFISSGIPPASNRMCKDSVYVTFETMDTSPTGSLVAIHLLDGEAGKQFCTLRRPPEGMPHPAITIPTLTPPAGAPSSGGGSSWGNNNGTSAASLQTTMPADSVLYHYVAQLVAGGWNRLGKPVVGDGVAVQRFTIREKQESWEAALVVLNVGDRREVTIRYSKVE